MGAGGTAPAMKMSDVFILTGLTLLLGGLFMHAWVTPIAHSSEDPPYTNGASMMKGDAFVLDIEVDNQTTLRIVLMDENGDIVSAESFVLAAGEQHNEVLEMLLHVRDRHERRARHNFHGHREEVDARPPPLPCRGHLPGVWPLSTKCERIRRRNS